MSDLFAALAAIFFIICAIFGVGLVGFGLYADSVTSTDTIKITEKIGAHGDEGQYLIIAQTVMLQENVSWGDTTGWVRNKTYVTSGVDKVLTVEDNLIYLKFDASDRYANLKTGKIYHVKCTGFRNHLLSWYPNIIEYAEIT